MNFRSRHADDEPEINLIPLIDVLLVILIFLAATTSFTRFNQMKLALPEAQADALDTNALSMAVSQERSEEHTSELQSLMRISYAVFCLKKQNLKKIINKELK